MRTTKPLLAFSMGDPAGIGPEIIIKACRQPSLRRMMTPLVIGDAQVMAETVKQLGGSEQVVAIQDVPDQPIKASMLPVLQLPGKHQRVKPGYWHAGTGERSYQAVVQAIDLARQKRVQAMVTAPICKAAWQAAGINYPGHTEVLAAKCSYQKKAAMMFVGGPFRLILVTIHQPLARVSRLLTKDKIVDLITVGTEELRCRFGIKRPKIAVAGFNPHAGEDGLFGSEEKDKIIPAIMKLKRSKKMSITGPYPPDTLFIEAAQGKFDLVVCMYHDQGLIPFKMLALYQGVNVTAGLPIIRTSPDHGTAFDLAGKNLANPGSMIAAIKTAVEMIKFEKMIK